MNASEYILSRQMQWARNQGIKLVGSKGFHGRPAYTQNLNDNLFEALLPSVREELNSGDGGELSGKDGSLPKMHAVHSSSALGVNVFQYWLKINQVPQIAAACGFCRKGNKSAKNIRFEVQYPISNKFRYAPNLDVVIENSPSSAYRVFAIECKFSEAYSSRGHSGIDPKYLELDKIWEDLSGLRSFAESISPKDTRFTYLHPAQLVKHILGLKERFGKKRFRLLYLWYDCLGHEGAKHRDEIKTFMEITKADGVRFHALNYQELIVRLASEYRTEHEEYIGYISGRYL